MSIRRVRLGDVASIAAGVALLVLGLASGPPASAEETVSFDLLVAQASAEEGPIDPGARRLHAHIEKEFRYGSLQVLDKRTLRIGLGGSGSATLPNGKKITLQPILSDDQGILVGVDVEGAVRGDFRVKRGQLVVIGAQGYRDGKLVIALEAH